MPGTSSSGGRNKKSHRAHALAGTGRKDRGTKKPPTSAAPPEPPSGRPPMPIGLIGPALEEWMRMVARLEAAKTLSIVDDAALYQYCCLFAETELVIDTRRGNTTLIDTLQRAIDKWTRLVDRLEAAAVTRSKDIQLQAAIEAQTYGAQILEAIAQIVQLKKLDAKFTAQLRMGHMALRQYLVEFGMTPAARGRVQVPDHTPTAPTDPFAEFDTPAGSKH